MFGWLMLSVTDTDDVVKVMAEAGDVASTAMMPPATSTLTKLVFIRLTPTL